MPAHSSLFSAYKEYCSKDPKNNNLKKISRITGIAYSSVHDAIHGKHKMYADTWLTLMRYFDAIIIKK